MKKIISIFSLVFAIGFATAQQSANRFFYELTFKPKKDSATLDKVMTILDITKEKSIYQDYTVIAQDSIILDMVKKMEKSGVYTDITKSIRMPKFSFKIIKSYPSMKIQYTDRISRNVFGYEEELPLNWKISNEKQKIGEYTTQKATTEYGGRKWTAWFSTDHPFQDGPYKFHGLPGLIVKIEDAEKNYSWELKGNKPVDNYSELSETDKINAKYGVSSDVKVITKEKFDKSMSNFKADPLAEVRPYMTSEFMNRKMPGSEMTVGEMLKSQEKMARDFFDANDNPIELNDIKSKK